MFLNVRLMAAAMAVTIVLLICGFVAFAALRVNREPFGRLPGAAPLQLAEPAAPVAMQLAAGPAFGSRMALDEAKIAAAAAPVAAGQGETDMTSAPAASAATDAGVADTAPVAAIPIAVIAEMPLPALAEDTAPVSPSDAAAAPAPPSESTGTATADAAAGPRPEDRTESSSKAEESEMSGIRLRRRPHRLAKADSDDREESASHAAKNRHAAARKAISRERVAANPPAHRLHLHAAAQPATRKHVVRLRRAAPGEAVGGPFVSPPPTQ